MAYLSYPVSKGTGLLQILLRDLPSRGSSVVGAGDTHSVTPRQSYDNHAAGEHPVDEA